MNYPLQLSYYLRKFLNGTATYLSFKSDKSDLLHIAYCETTTA